jgi:hypothetical protein
MASAWGEAWGSAWGDAWGALDKGAYVLVGLSRNWLLLAVARDFTAVCTQHDFIVDEIVQQSQISALPRRYTLTAPAPGEYTALATQRSWYIAADSRVSTVNSASRIYSVSQLKSLTISATIRTYKVQS